MVHNYLQIIINIIITAIAVLPIATAYEPFSCPLQTVWPHVVFSPPHKHIQLKSFQMLLVYALALLPIVV